MSHRRLFPVLLLSLLPITTMRLQPGVVASSSLSFDVQFTPWGYDPQEVLFHQIVSPKNLSLHHASRPYTAHRKRQVLPRKKRKHFVPDKCDCSRIDGVMYARPAPLRDEATGEVASFKTTLCLRTSRGEAAGTGSLFLFLVPYPWDANGERIEVGLRNECTDQSSGSIGGDDDGAGVACAHVHYDSAKELLLAKVLVGGRTCVCGRKIDRGRMPREAAVGFASTTAGDPVELRNVLTWAFHSTLESKDPPRMTTQPDDQVATGEESSWTDSGHQRLRVDPWNRNAELNLRYQRNWQSNWQLTCSISISVGYGNANGDTD